MGSTFRFTPRNSDQAVAFVFAAIVVASLVVDAAHRAFWQRSHDIAPVAAAIVLLILVALVRRHRWAWWTFLVVSMAGLPSFVIYRVAHHPGWATVVGLIIGLAQVGLLLSSPMRRYVGIGRWHESQDATRAAPM